MWSRYEKRCWKQLLDKFTSEALAAVAARPGERNGDIRMNIYAFAEDALQVVEELEARLDKAELSQKRAWDRRQIKRSHQYDGARQALTEAIALITDSEASAISAASKKRCANRSL